MTHEKLIALISKFVPRLDIPGCQSKVPYMRRWKFYTSKLWASYLHCFELSDEDRALHDHPFSFFSIILWRGYYEHTEEEAPYVIPNQNTGGAVQKKLIKKVKRIWPGMILWRPAEWKHRVELVDGKRAWTFVIRLNRRREWGFYVGENFIHWKNWLATHCN